jgi:formylglycine-generating enzyme required for sulfatase activity
MSSKPEIRDLDEFSKIPEGVFPYQDGEDIEVSEFWLGRYEVTIYDYSQFLEALRADPTLTEKIRHPDQPENKTSYLPEKWGQIYGAAMKGRKFLGGPVDPNCPVIGVDWWDAYAYAKWRGGRLPTEQEWEKAARGRSGSNFPWGDEIVPSNFNSGLDHEANETTEEGGVDGYKYWCPVDAIEMDESRYAIIGLAGNVSEWTATWGAHPDSPDKQVPLKRGASFATKSGFDLKARRAGETAEERNFFTGFRIAADSPDPEPLSAPVGAEPTDDSPAPSEDSEAESTPPAEPEGEMTPDAPAPETTPGTPANDDASPVMESGDSVDSPESGDATMKPEDESLPEPTEPEA